MRGIKAQKQHELGAICIYLLSQKEFETASLKT